MLAIYNYYADRGNFGDLLLLEIFRRWIEDDFGEKVVFPFVSKDRINYFKKYFPTAKSGLQGYKSWRALIYAGGGNFGEPDRVSGKKYTGEWNLWMIKKCFPAELCMFGNIPYGLIGIEAGPLSNIFSRREVRRLVNGALNVSVRNQESYNFLKSGLNIGKDIYVTYDPVLSLSKEMIPATAIENIGKKLNQYPDCRLIGIHHPHYLVSGTNAANGILNAFINRLKSSRDIVPVVFSDSGYDGSVGACEKLSSRISEATGVRCLSVPFDGIWELVALISRLSSLLTTKMHVGIVAYTFGVYCESFSAHQKTSMFYKLIRRESQFAPIKSLTGDLIEKKISNLFRIANQPNNTVDQHYSLIKEVSLKNREMIRAFL